MRKWLCLVSMLSVVVAPQISAAQGKETALRTVEIRSYNLKPGTRDRFQQLAIKEAVPMLRRWKVDVVAHGPSLHDKDSYFLMRAFTSVEQRQKDEDAFYGSQEWIAGPRDRVLADIDSYTTIVVHLDDATLQGLRKAGSAMTGANDLDVLTKLNDDYIQSVQHSNVKRFDEILAADFLCSNPDGTLIDKKAFLAQTAKPVTIRNLEAHEVNVRLMGDFAIIHARTSYTTADGAEAGGRYTDVWARRNGKWVAVSAHVTRR
jgi:ketosteroid isomerase-like protein